MNDNSYANVKFFIGNILIYDDKNIKYWSGQPIQMYQSSDFADTTTIIDGTTTRVHLFDTITIQTSGFNEKENINLDPTTMKRIATYNKEAECKRLDEKIKDKKQQLRELEDKLSDREKRWDKVKSYITNIYEIDIDEEDNDYDDWD